MAQAPKPKRVLDKIYRSPADATKYPGRWLVVTIEAGDATLRTTQPFPFKDVEGEKVALSSAQRYQAQMKLKLLTDLGRTVREALDMYRAALVEARRASGTIATIVFRVESYFPDDDAQDNRTGVYPRDFLLGDLDEEICGRLFTRLHKRPIDRQRGRFSAKDKQRIIAAYNAAIAAGIYGGASKVARDHGLKPAQVKMWIQRGEPKEISPPTGDTLLNTMGDVRRFLKWCVQQKMLAVNPLANWTPPEGVTRNPGGKGRVQLSVDNLVVWQAKCAELAELGDVGAAAAWLSLHLGLRERQLLNRTCGDVDAGGVIFRALTYAKTSRSAQLHEISDDRLVDVMASLKVGRPDTAPLWGEETPGKGWLTRNIRRVCRAAGVPEFTHAHGMRGASATLGEMSLETLERIQKRLGHRQGDTITRRRYAAAEAIARRRQKALMTVVGSR